MKTRYFLFSFYAFVNILMFLMYLFGYKNLFPIKNTIELEPIYYFFNILLLISSLYILLKLFSIIEKYLKVKQLKIKLEAEKNTVGLLIIILQLIFTYTFIFHGGNVIGKEDHMGGGLYGMLMSASQIGFLQIVYLVSVRNKNFVWWAVFWLFIIINIITGKSGFILLLAILYLFQLEEKKKLISYSKISIILLSLIIVFYPIIYLIKLSIRITTETTQSFNELNLVNSLGNDSWSGFALYTYTQLLERFEQYYLTLGCLMNSNAIATAYDKGLIIPYYLEGFQTKIYKLFDEDYIGISLGNYMPSVFYDNYYLGTDFWNISPGFQSLFYTDSISILFIFPYYIFLFSIIIIVFRLLNMSSLAYNFIYFYIILLLFPGWFSQFFYLTWSIIVIFIIVQFFGTIRLTLKKVRIK